MNCNANANFSVPNKLSYSLIPIERQIPKSIFRNKYKMEQIQYNIQYPVFPHLNNSYSILKMINVTIA